MKFKIIITIVLSFLSYLRIDGCTVISITEGESVYVGNNEDWYIPYPKYRIIPGSDTTYGRIIFSYPDNWGQGGMNEKGLFFDWVLKNEASTSWKPDPLKTDIPGNLSKKILSQCASVEEALKYYEEFNEPVFKISFIALVDTSGQSAFVSWENGELKIDRCKGVCMAGYSADKTLNKYKETERPINKEKMVKLLDAGHQEGDFPTLYSNVYDLKKGVIHLYYFHNYEEEIILDLQAEIKKGAHSVDLEEIFETQIPKDQFKDLRKEYIISEIKTNKSSGSLFILIISHPILNN